MADPVGMVQAGITGRVGMAAGTTECVARDVSTAKARSLPPPIPNRMSFPTTANRSSSNPVAECSNCTPTATASSATRRTIYPRERTDPFVPGTMIEKFRLREGVLINGMVQQSRKQQGPRLKEIIDVDGMKPEDYPQRQNASTR